MSPGASNALFLDICFPPELVAPRGSALYDAYVRPVLDGGPYLLADGGSMEGFNVLRLLGKLHDTTRDGDATRSGVELRRLGLVLLLWLGIYHLVESSGDRASRDASATGVAQTQRK